jgi:hypothetical protein
MKRDVNVSIDIHGPGCVTAMAFFPEHAPSLETEAKLREKVCVVASKRRGGIWELGIMGWLVAVFLSALQSFWQRLTLQSAPLAHAPLLALALATVLARALCRSRRWSRRLPRRRRGDAKRTRASPSYRRASRATRCTTVRARDDHAINPCGVRVRICLKPTPNPKP